MRSPSRSAPLLAVLLSLAAPPAGATEFWVDPVKGSDDADGSAATPWRSLQATIEQKVETRRWQSHPWAEGMPLVPANAGAPVKAGDTIWLRSGDHGALSIVEACNSGDVTVAAEAGQVPRFTNVEVRSSQHWVLRGFSVSPSHGATPSTATIVTVEDHGWTGPSSDVVVEGFDVFTVPDERAWSSREDWSTLSANGLSADADRVTVRNCRLRNVNYGIQMSGAGSRVEHNLVDGFCGDGLRGLGDGEVFEYNLVKNARAVNDTHRDGFQSWSVGDGGVGTGVVRDVTLRGNVFIGFESSSVPFAGTLQGIGCFDGTYDGWVVENNVVITEHWHGISLYGARNSRVANNTVLGLVDPVVEDGRVPGPPWILVTAHKDGTPSSDTVVRNNLATSLTAEGEGVVEDHNLILPDGLAGYFVDVAGHDVRLVEGAPAVDQGSAASAPEADADGVARPYGAAVDVGAFEYAPGAARPDGGFAGPADGTFVPVDPAPSGATAGCGLGLAGPGPGGALALAALLLLGVRRWALGGRRAVGWAIRGTSRTARAS